ncbi:hypothetical protein Lal_00036460 [Lupinus albus]|nr:hypothetical protein Lal_00036460 [Lupinus albus]
MDFKSKKAYIMWDVLEEDSTSSTSEEEENAKLCLMVITQESSTTTNIYKQSDENSYETSSCSKLEKLARVNVDRKRVILLHEKKIKYMQK